MRRGNGALQVYLQHPGHRERYLLWCSRDEARAEVASLLRAVRRKHTQGYRVQTKDKGLRWLIYGDTGSVAAGCWYYLVIARA